MAEFPSTFDDAWTEWRGEMREEREAAAGDDEPEVFDAPYEGGTELDVEEAEGVVLYAVEHWDDLSPEQQAVAIGLAHELDAAIEEREGQEHDTAREGANRLVDDLVANGYDESTLRDLWQRHDGDQEQAMAALLRIGPARPGASMDDAISQHLRHLAELRD